MKQVSSRPDNKKKLNHLHYKHLAKDILYPSASSLLGKNEPPNKCPNRKKALIQAYPQYLLQGHQTALRMVNERDIK